MQHRKLCNRGKSGSVLQATQCVEVAIREREGERERRVSG